MQNTYLCCLGYINTSRTVKQTKWQIVTVAGREAGAMGDQKDRQKGGIGLGKNTIHACSTVNTLGGIMWNVITLSSVLFCNLLLLLFIMQKSS